MHFEKLEKAPLSGEYYEKHFGNVDANSLWMKFYSDDKEPWIGSFKNGGFKIENQRFFENNSKQQVAILKNGAFYIINYDSKELIFHPDDDDFIDFKINPESNQIFLATFSGICIYEDYLLKKEISPELIDGIRFKGINNGKLIGEIYEPGLDWSEFELNTNTLVLKWGKYEFK